jgi:Carboxypeptidase regulatory-like domain
LGHVRASSYILALVLAAGSAVGAPQQSTANERMASVKGVVTNAVTGERLRKAYVRLHPASGDARPATTDDQGRFGFDNLKPGTYRLEAEHLGFLLSLFTDATGTSIELHLTAGETADVNVKLTPQAAISGRLVDSDGDPWVHGSIRVSRSVFKQGKRQLEGAGDGGEVDDRGQFRVGQLAPGTYYVSGVPSAGWEVQNRSRSEGGLQSAWYPSAFDLQNATPVVLSPGQELSGVEIRLRRSAMYRIRGTVSGLDAIPKVAGQPAQVYRRVWASPVSGGAGLGHEGRLRPDGTFEIEGVPSGEYDVALSQGMPPVVLGETKVRVDDRDVDGLSIEARSYTLKGSVRFDGNETGRIAGLSLMLTALDSNGGQFGRTREDGGFEFPLVSTGRYRLFLPGTYDGQYHVKLFRYGGKESRSGIISITNGDSLLELVLSSHGARVVVDVKKGDTAAPAVAARVVLIPDTEGGEERGFGTRPAVRDQNGVYSIGNIAKGVYRLFAFESVPEEAWVDAEFWKQIRNKGVELSVNEGDSRNAEVPLVLRSEIAGLLSRLGME